MSRRFFRSIESAGGHGRGGSGRGWLWRRRLGLQDRGHGIGRHRQHRFGRHFLEVERGDGLRLVVLAQREILTLQVADDVAVAVADDRH